MRSLLVATDAQVMSALVYRNLSYDPLRDLQMLGTIARTVFILSVAPSLPVQTTEEFIRYARARPGSSWHLGHRQPASHRDGDLRAGSGHRTAACALQGLGRQRDRAARGHDPGRDGIAFIVCATCEVGSALVLWASRPNDAWQPSRRYPRWPRAVLSAEDGLYGLFAPTGTPRPILERLHIELNRVLRDRAYTDEKLGKIGLEPFESATVDSAAALMKVYYDKLAPVVKKAAIKLD
jgi:hypothetical protein